MAVERSAKPELRQLVEQFPAVALLGPRQVGKTTLALSLAKDLDQNATGLPLPHSGSLQAKVKYQKKHPSSRELRLGDGRVAARLYGSTNDRKRRTSHGHVAQSPPKIGPRLIW